MKSSIFSFWFLFLIVIVTTASRSAEAVAPAFLPAQDRWQMTVDGDEVQVERRVQMGEPLATLVRGNAALDPGALETELTAGGARSAACHTEDGPQGLALTCRYVRPLAAQQVTLPDQRFLHFLLQVPVETAQGVTVETAGEVTVPGLLAGLPAEQSLQLENGGYYRRQYALSSLSTLVVTGETQLPPGQLPFALATPVTVAFLPRYQPRPSAWIALLFALAMALFAVSRLLPVRARLPLQPRLWQPDLGRLPRLLRSLAALLVRLVNWLQKNWPLLLNGGMATMLIVVGGQLLVIAWNLARLYDEVARLRVPLQELVDALPLTLPVDALSWVGWPFVVAGGGALLLATGAGMLARRKLARLLVVAAFFAMAGGVILSWPRILLAPPLLPAQLELVFVLGAGILLVGVVLVRGLTHPQFRRYYLGLNERG